MRDIRDCFILLFIGELFAITGAALQAFMPQDHLAMFLTVNALAITMYVTGAFSASLGVASAVVGFRRRGRANDA